MIAADTPESKGKLVIEFEQEKGHEHKMFKDDREKDRGKIMEWVDMYWSTTSKRGIVLIYLFYYKTYLFISINSININHY